MSSLDEIYTENNVPIFEALYGNGLISLGGYPAVEQMVEELALTNKQVLDIGSGIGGVAHYLAEHHHADVVGLDVHPWMADYAFSVAPESIQSQLRFMTYAANGAIPLADNTFDWVVSKGVLTNIENKLALFQEVNRVLKPGGAISIIDWLLPKNHADKKEVVLHTGEASYKETQTSYMALLQQCHFKHIEFVDVTADYYQHAMRLLSTLQSKAHTQQHVAIISFELRSMVIEATQKLVRHIENQEQLAMRVRAQK